MWAPEVSFGSKGHWEVYEAAERPDVSAFAVMKGALAAGAAALLLFFFVPNIDMAVTHIFYQGGQSFVGNSSPAFLATRASFSLMFYLTCIATLAGLVVAGRPASGICLGLAFNKWLFLALCLILGPLVVSNIGFKDHWGRARPRDVVEFGGAKAFTPVFPPSDQCGRNCSFVSGEASSVYIVFFAAAFLFRRHARRMIALGIVLGSVAGLTRIAQGGHFLSDVVFAGVFMALTAACLQLLFDTIRAADVAERQEASA
jgi:lipid A 4'-phosphatase